MITRVTGELQVARALEICDGLLVLRSSLRSSPTECRAKRETVSVYGNVLTHQKRKKIFATKFLLKKYLTTVFIYSFASSQFSFGCL